MQIGSALQSLLALFGGGVVVIVAIVTAAYGLFRLFGEKWLDAKFAERREALKHEQQKELEALKIQIARLIDRPTKLNQREFDIIPEAWARLYEAYARTRGLVASLQSYPDIDNMTSDHQTAFIASCELHEWEKKEIATLQRKTDYFVERIFWHHLSKVKEFASQSHTYIKKNMILFPKSIGEQFIKFDQLIWDVLSETEFNHSSRTIPQEHTHRQNFTTNGDILIENLERLIQDRLFTLTEQSLDNQRNSAAVPSSVVPGW